MTFMNSPKKMLNIDFVTNYGSYAQPFDAIDSLGNQTFATRLPIFVSLATLFCSALLFSFGRQEYDSITKQYKDKTLKKKVLTVLGWLLLICTLGGFGYGIYLYFAVYMTQYAKWFESLPTEAKTSIGMIQTIQKLSTNYTDSRTQLFR
jgi:hypothetical protein